MNTRYATVTAALSLMFVFGCPVSGAKVRPSQGAGKWYPADKAELTKALDRYLAEKPDTAREGRPIGIISPHAGFRFSGKAAGAGYAALKGHACKRVIVLGFSHRRAIKGASILNADAYATPLGDIPIDTAVTKKLLEHKLFETQPAAHAGEHSLDNQLPFLHHVLPKGWKLVPILIGGPGGGETGISAKSLEMYSEIADAIRPFIDDETLVVASSDWTHYGANFGYYPFGRRAFLGDELRPRLKALDYETIKPALDADAKTFAARVNARKATVCGRWPICVLLMLMPDGARGSVAKYYTSGDLTNDWRSSVSYASIVITAAKKVDADGEIGAAAQKRLLSIARETLEAALNGKARPKFKADPPELGLKRGVFVTLNKAGKLRGCIGCFTSDEPLYKVVSDYAIISATRDSRFRPVTAAELKDIKIEISVLSPMRRVKDPLKEIVIGTHGIYIKRGTRSGTFLPQVAVDHKMSVVEFLSICSEQKARLSRDAWKDPRTEVYVYTACVFHEE